MNVSVIIPTLNEASVLDGTLNSVADRGFEIVIADGGSTDDTLAIARYHGVRVVASARGRAAQLQAGIEASKGELIWMLHADTKPSWQAMRAITNNRDDWGRFDIRLDDNAWWAKMIGFMISWRSRLTGIASGDQAIFVRRELLREVGGVPQQPLMEDIELARRLKRLAAPTSHRATVLSSARRWRDHGVTRTIVLMWSLRLAYYVGCSPARLARWYR